jgi:exonuclease III
MTGNNRHLSILTLNINGLNAPIKRYKIANWVKKDATTCCLQDTHLLKKVNTGLVSKGGKKFSKKMDPINKQE